ncbi:MAG: ferric reductase-like transmembrane domain-containing protein [Bryobacterales bacterium]|nr:ferric reductase-like transmembrane domain-containing protein [Bryobacterales bacterium]
MSVHYQAVGWNRDKRVYDAVLLSFVACYLLLFAGAGTWIHPSATIETLLIRGLGTLALFLLHVILAIGPLCRLDPRFLPLLYNRRHLGVTTFLIALAHGLFTLVQFHAFGDVPVLESLFTSNTRYGSLREFPFEALGAIALAWLFLLAATSHDFWLNALSPAVWKTLHMGVYGVYVVLVGHVALGVLQAETNPVFVIVLATGAAMVVTLHIAAARREQHRDESAALSNGFAEVCRFEDIPEKRARIVCVGGERIAVFRHDGKVSALSNVCRHQGGPLGEGRIVDGCVTCPWHGYQYLPETGGSPPPFQEQVATFETRVVDGMVYVSSEARLP